MILESTVKKYLSENYPDEVDEKLINYLCDSQIIRPKSVNRALIRHEYMKRLKSGEMITAIISDLSIEFEVSESTIRNYMK